MRAFMRFFAKEMTELLRTWRLPVLGGTVLFFAAAGPVLAMMTPQILESMQFSQPGVVIQVPDSTWIDAYGQWIKNLSQIVAFVAIISAAGSVSSEVANGTVGLIVTKPVSRAAFVVSKWVAFVVTLTVIVTMGAAVTMTVTRLLFGEAPLTELWTATFAWLAYAAVLAAIAVLMSCVMPTMAAAMITIAVFFAMTVAALWQPLVSYTPIGLSTAPQELLTSGDPALLWPLLTSALTIVVVMIAAALSFQRREL